MILDVPETVFYIVLLQLRHSHILETDMQNYRVREGDVLGKLIWQISGFRLANEKPQDSASK